MDDRQVYLEKLSAFSRLLRAEGIAVSPQETADACAILLRLGFADRAQVKQALSAIYAKSRQEQLVFDRVFDTFFVSREVMEQRARELAQKQAQMDQLQQQAQQQLQINGQPLLMTEDQKKAYAAMPQQEREHSSS